MSWRIKAFARPGVAAALALLLSGTASPAAAHDIPANVSVQAFVKPEGQTLNVLLRVPLESMRDMLLALRGPGYIVVSESQQQLRDAAELWLAGYLNVYENGARLEDAHVVATHVSIPSDDSFGTYEEALAHVHSAPLPDDVDLMWNQALFDVLIQYPITSETSDFSMEPGLAHLGIETNTTLRFLPPGGAVRAYQYIGNPGLVRLDPHWYQAAFNFVQLGFFHILGGIDHLLFIFCLVIPFRRLRPLLTVITSFTVAHSITLGASVFGLAPKALWFPPLIEALIALSIVYMALENIVGAKLERRWWLAFGFGLVHGFGFSFLLTESLQFAGSHLATSLFAFNVGVELGQIFVLLLAIPALELLFRRFVRENIGTIILSALVAHTAWHWMLDRWGTLRQYDFQLPVLDAAFMASMMRWAMLILAVGGVAWLLSEIYSRLGGSVRSRDPNPEAEG